MPKVVTLAELCAEPNGAIFSTFDPNIVAGLYRRGETLRHDQTPDSLAHWGGEFADFFYHTLLAEVDSDKSRGEPKDSVFRNPRHGGRWGNLDPEELFVVYDPADIYYIIEFLTGTATVKGEKPSGS